MSEAKKFFKSIREAQRELRSLEEEKDRLFTMLTRTTSRPKDVNVQSSPSGDKMTEITQKLIELDEIIKKQVNKILEKQIFAEKIICRLDKMEYRAVLRWYYVENLKWHEVAVRMDYHQVTVQKLNGKALEEAERLFDGLKIP